MYQHKGVVLVVSLIILLILSMMGAALLQSASIEAKITTTLQDTNVALQSAESALRQAETWIQGLSDTSAFNNNTNGLYTLGNAPDPFTSGIWSGSNVVTVNTNLGGATAPSYFIELQGTFSADQSTNMNVYNYGQGSSPSSTVFRIVARGTGATGTSQVILEEFYGRVM